MQPDKTATAGLSEARRTLLERYLRGKGARIEAKPATIPKAKRIGARSPLLQPAANLAALAAGRRLFNL